MSLARSTPLPFSPTGLSDAQDGTNVFRGAMQLLRNLIPDAKTKNVWTCRPASILETSFAGFVAPGAGSALLMIGTRGYGMIASAAFVGKDEPFCYDFATGAFVAITGMSGANTPTTQPTVGEWTPPTMDVIGPYVIVTHPGFATGANFFGWIDLTNPAAPVWNAGNTATNLLAEIPTAVKQFGNRAWFIVNDPAQPAVVFSDVLDPLTVTNANQALTFDDSTPLTCLGALQLSTQLGGIVQALIVFKGFQNMYQITGDAALSTLASNAMNVATGAYNQNAIASTPKGLAFVSPEGVRLIDFQAKVSEPIGVAGMGVAAPFVYAEEATRVAMAATADTLRVSVKNGDAENQPYQEYWYHISRSVWSGPHTFPATMIQPYGKSFVLFAQGIPAKLWMSDTVQFSTSTFVENEAQMIYEWQPCVLPDTKRMCENAMLETTINFTLARGASPTVVQARDPNGQVFNTVIVAASAATTVWGAFVWGQASWQASATGLFPVQVPWEVPIVFRKLSIYVQGNSYIGFNIGDMFMRYEQLGYLQQVGVA